ncbi:hypothetical protein DFJ74DRAFT_696436 [Hyaloraphidium curvatum]|nr:hypothetical protein DFJ74DRAFT_696436 [Hyaloraphidium curvatum]
MVFEISGKRALVTGGTEGIGRALTEGLLGLGARVVIANRNADKGREVVADLRARFGDRAAGFVRADVCNRGEVRDAFAKALELLGGVDIVVANSGFSTDAMPYNRAEGTRLTPGDLDSEEDSRWLHDIDGNLVGFGQLVRCATAYWWKNGMPGAFVANASAAAVLGLDAALVGGHPSFSYGPTKAAQVSMMCNMQAFVDTAAGGRSAIRFASVLPGMTFTHIFAAAGCHTPEEVERHPIFGRVVAKSGGWVPMEKLVDAFVRCIEDEEVRGQAFEVIGSGGNMVPYIRDFGAEEYITTAGP